MTQTEVNRAVARNTGETVDTIESLGFSLVDDELSLAGIEDLDEAASCLDCPGCGRQVVLTQAGAARYGAPIRRVHRL